MNDLRTTDRRNQALAWGAIFIAVGAVNLIPARRAAPACWPLAPSCWCSTSPVFAAGFQ